ncbi:MAG: hypothetical protein E7559_06510 [Ruminococcaceae bacterium]|nr:hypothetical protein [Oscillospiraceae bacterium]
MKKQLNRQAISFSLVLFLSWFSVASFGIIPEIIDMIAGDTNTFKYAVPEQMMALAPAAIMIAITLALNYILKPDLSRSFKMHIAFGFVTILICTILLASFVVLSTWADGRLYSNLALLHINLYWIVPVVSLLIEAGCYIKQRLYQKPKELIVLLASSASICLLMTYIVELFVVGLSI